MLIKEVIYDINLTDKMLLDFLKELGEEQGTLLPNSELQINEGNYSNGVLSLEVQVLRQEDA